MRYVHKSNKTIRQETHMYHICSPFRLHYHTIYLVIIPEHPPSNRRKKHWPILYYFPQRPYWISLSSCMISDNNERFPTSYSRTSRYLHTFNTGVLFLCLIFVFNTASAPSSTTTTPFNFTHNLTAILQNETRYFLFSHHCCYFRMHYHVNLCFSPHSPRACGRSPIETVYFIPAPQSQRPHTQKSPSSELQSAPDWESQSSRLHYVEISRNPRFSYEKIKTTHYLTAEHNRNRFIWYRKLVSENKISWSQAVFFDESKFNCDGLEGYRFYWHDFAQNTHLLLRNQGGVTSLMLCGAVSKYGTASLVELEGKQDSRKYARYFRTAWYILQQRLWVRTGFNSRTMPLSIALPKLVPGWRLMMLLFCTALVCQEPGHKHHRECLGG